MSALAPNNQAASQAAPSQSAQPGSPGAASNGPAPSPVDANLPPGEAPSVQATASAPPAGSASSPLTSAPAAAAGAAHSPQPQWRAAATGRTGTALTPALLKRRTYIRRALVVAVVTFLALCLLPWRSALESLQNAAGGLSKLTAKEQTASLSPEQKATSAEPLKDPSSDPDAAIKKLEAEERLREREFERWKREQDRIREKNRELDQRIAAEARVRAVVDLSGEALDKLSALRQELRLWKAKVDSLPADDDGRRIAARGADVLAYLRLTASQTTDDAAIDKIQARVRKILDDVQQARRDSETFAPSTTLDDQLRRERDEADRMLGELKAKRERLETLIRTAEPQASGSSLSEAIAQQNQVKADEERKAALAEREKWRQAMLKSIAEGEQKRGAEKAKALDILVNSVWSRRWGIVQPKTRKIEELDDPKYHEWVDIKAKYVEDVVNLELAIESLRVENEDILQYWMINAGIFTWTDFGTTTAKKWCEAYRRDFKLLLIYYPQAFMSSTEYRNLTNRSAASMYDKRKDYEAARRRQNR